jgi:uncharacterized protein involved in exopolysaccharide biosynthesis
MPNEVNEFGSDDRRPLPTLRDLFAIIFRQWWVMLGVFLLILLGVAVSGVLSPKYEAEMKILVRRQRVDPVVTPQQSNTQVGRDEVSEEDINSEVELLNSRDLLRNVALQTGLKQEESVGFSTADGDEVRIAKAVRRLGVDLKIEPLRKTNVISVRYRSSDPELATKVLKAMAVGYMEKHLEVHRPLGEFKFFDQQTTQYREGLRGAEQKLTDFTQQQGVVSAQVERDLALQKLNEFDGQSRQAQAGVAETEQRIRALQAQLTAMQPRMTTQVRTFENVQLMQQLKSTLLNLELKRTELLTKFDPSYRLVQEVEKQIAEARASIAAEESKPVREETTDQNPTYQWLRSELAKAETDRRGLKAKAGAAGAIAVQYRDTARRLQDSGLVQQDLLRAAKTEEDNYLLYVRKREDARISDALDQRGILNVAIAEQPTVPALPARSPFTAGFLALFLATSVSLTAAFACDFIDPSFRTPDEVVAYLRTPVLAALPKNGK